jgi:hypothetical protein
MIVWGNTQLKKEALGKKMDNGFSNKYEILKKNYEYIFVLID